VSRTAIIEPFDSSGTEYTNSEDAKMSAQDWGIFLIIGATAGWLAGAITRGGYNLFGNIIVGVLGAILGKFALGWLGIDSGGIFRALITATSGAVILLAIAGTLKK